MSETTLLEEPIPIFTMRLCKRLMSSWQDLRDNWRPQLVITHPNGERKSKYFDDVPEFQA